MTTFVPAEVDATTFPPLEPLFRDLLERPVTSPGALEAWLLDRGELIAAVGEGRSRLYIAMTCRTGESQTQEAFTRYLEDVAPRLSPLFFELDTRLVDLERAHRLDEARYAVLLRNARADVAIFRPENVPLVTEIDKLAQQYDQVCGAMTVEFDGQTRTPSQMARYLELPERATRERAWRSVAERRLNDRERVDAIYDELVALRTRVARNAGFDTYTPYAFAQLHRFDYGVAACERFHEAVEREIVPLVRRLEAQRARTLGVQTLRPWDLAVDVKGRPPLRPFDTGADLIARMRTVFRRLDPRLGELFERLGDGTESVRSDADVGRVRLDLDSRPGKAPGGYQSMLHRSRVPFIFMNAAGLQRDVMIMAHEAGHAFHSMLCEHEPLVEYRDAPIEFAEVASMAMELLSMRHWGPLGPGRAFYDDDESFRRAQRDQLQQTISRLPWIATIDAFQHWVYANPGHTRDARTAQWLALDARFGSSVSWEGLEPARDAAWQRQGHLFSYPFYYIEYAIAQLGALQLWLDAVEKDEADAIGRYTSALALGGSRPLPELFARAGLPFDFGPEIVSRLAEGVERHLERLPE
ncbi:MAG: M3 family oligoendopeptidase [Planctomycetota bacterium]|nr:M3 family oligoendopeptidase [Planctomycetota bacterium]